MSLDMWNHQQGSLPPKMFRPLWSLKIMMMNMADAPGSRFRQMYGQRFHEALRETLTIWGEQIPCGTCSNGFLKDLLPTFPTAHLIQTQPRTLFKWAVQCRVRVSAKTGGKVYTEEECDRKDLDTVVLEAWDALLMMSFGYPPMPSADWMKRTLHLLRDLAWLWPNLSEAQVALWREIVFDPFNVSTKTNLVTTVLKLRQKIGNDVRLVEPVDAINWILPQIAYWNKIQEKTVQRPHPNPSPMSTQMVIREAKTVVVATPKLPVRNPTPVVVATVTPTIKHRPPVKSFGPVVSKSQDTSASIARKAEEIAKAVSKK